MSPESLKATAKQLVDCLVAGQYDELVRITSGHRLTGEVMARAVREYGRDLISPPPAVYESLDAVPVCGSAHPTWSVRVPLWSRQEGASDLCLEFTLVDSPDNLRVELDDIRVL